MSVVRRGGWAAAMVAVLAGCRKRDKERETRDENKIVTSKGKLLLKLKVIFCTNSSVYRGVELREWRRR